VAEDFYIDEFSLTPEKEPEKEKPVIQIPERKGQSTPVLDVLFGPKGVELAGDSFLSTGKVARRVAERVAGVEEDKLTPLGEIDPFTGFVAGVVDGTIKVPYGIASLTAEIMDALGPDNIPVDQGKVAQLEKYFSNTVFGKIQQGSEDVIKDSAIGKLTSALTQLYGYGRLGAAGAVKVAEKANNIYNKWSAAAKLNKVARASPNITKAGLRAKELNKLSGTQKFAAVTVGGATGTAMVADVEDIGTWGDVLGGPSALDREQRPTSEEDATRRLWNRFKFGAEGAAVSVPIAYGTNIIAKKIAKHGRELKYSDSKIDQLINKYMVQPFRPGGKKEQYLFEGIKKVEGKISAGQVTAADLIKDIDQTLYNVAKQSGLSTGNKNWKRIVGRLDELLTSTDDAIQGGKIVFKGFEPKKINQFYNFLDEVGISKPQGRTLVEEMIKVREQFNVFKNSLFQGGNVNAVNKEFSQIMSERMRNIFNSEYDIMKGKSIFPWLNYKPTEAVINDVKGVFQRYAKQNNINLTDADLDVIIDDIYNNIKYNEITKTPEFPMTVLSVLDDKATQIINIADNIKGGRFKPTTLIQSEQDLRAFQRFYGQKRDLRNTIINTVNDLTTLAAKDEFYNGVLQKSKEFAANGQRATVYPTRLEALRNLQNQDIITNPTGLQIKSPLGESIYTNPLNGQFTSKELKDALQFSEKILFDKLSKEVAYQHLVLIPKGLTQISKTILGPFTHTRNFLTSAQFSLGTGNLFKNPVEIVRNFKQAFNTIQPQLLYRNTPKDQALYKFLLEEQVTSSSATARDIAGLLDDIGRGGDVYMRFFGKFGKAMKKLYEKAGDLYVAEDDTFKVFNFLGEFDSYKKAYQKALKAGKIKTMPNDLQIMKESANIVRNTVPNYAYVGEFGQAVRRLPFGNFISFPIEVTRTAANIMELGLKEANNPIFKEIGYKRLLGLATATATAPVVAATVVGAMYGVTSAMISAAREFVPSFSEGSTLFVIREKDGSLKYIDASGSMVYDTIVNPMQSVIAGINSESTFDPNAPLTKGVFEGLTKGLARFVRPYVDESIWANVLTNLFIRDGVTPDGRRLWNPKSPWGEKIAAAAKYALVEVAPLSGKQMERLILAARKEPGRRGEKYELDDEIAGFWGLRGIKLDPVKSLNYKINNFKQGLRDTRNIFTSAILKGGPITPETILERYYVANQQRFKEYQTLKRKIQAAEILEAKNQDVVQLFSKRSELGNYAAVKRDKFVPFGITPTTIVEMKRQERQMRENFNDLDIPIGIDRDTLRSIQKMRQDMYKLDLNENFNKQIKLEDYLPEKQSSIPGAGSERQVTQVPPLPPQPMPNQQVVTPAVPQVAQLNQGLTPTESALLSQEEQQIRLRQRGLA